jgi:hypothetical protein
VSAVLQYRPPAIICAHRGLMSVRCACQWVEQSFEQQFVVSQSAPAMQHQHGWLASTDIHASCSTHHAGPAYEARCEAAAADGSVVTPSLGQGPYFYMVVHLQRLSIVSAAAVVLLRPSDDTILVS